MFRKNVMANSPQRSVASGNPRLSQVRVLRDFGLVRSERKAFFRVEAVVFSFSTGAAPAIAIIQLLGNRLCSGIISIHDIGGGLRDFVRFRDQAHRVARAFHADEVELFGAAVINERLEALLLRQGFSRAIVTVPEALGGGSMEILSRVFPVG
jgi:hypothetical protein